MRQGDTQVVWKLDRLARSLKQLIETVEGFGARDVGLRSLTEAIDTTTAGGKLVFHIFAALAEFERGVIRERKPMLQLPRSSAISISCLSERARRSSFQTTCVSPWRK